MESAVSFEKTDISAGAIAVISAVARIYSSKLAVF